MNSNVRISFATMLEDVPREVHVLLDDIRRRLRNTEDGSLLDISDSLEISSKVSDCNEAIVALESARKDLAKIDTRMEDCMNILYQYCSAVDSAPAQDLEEESADDEEG
jgi:hypothetical protein